MFDESAFNKALGTVIRITRKKAGISQKAMGEAMNVSHQQVQKYESGKDRLSVVKLVLIAEFLRIDEDALIEAARARMGINNKLGRN